MTTKKVLKGIDHPLRGVVGLFSVLGESGVRFLATTSSFVLEVSITLAT